MCGIVGFSGKKDFNPTLIKLLMLSNLPRGIDATGIYTPKSGLVKDTVHASAFIAKSEAEIKKDKLFIGHLRAKTIGLNTVENSHPYDMTNLIGAHNGTLTDYHSLARRFEIESLGLTVDSQYLYTIINKQIEDSNNDVLKLTVLSEFEGAAALIFYNKIDTNLYVYRNSQRPLHYGYVNGEMYIASLAESLTIINAKDITQFEENFLFKISNSVILSKTHYAPKVKETPGIVTYPSHKVMPSSEYVGYWFLIGNSDVHKRITGGNYYYVHSTKTNYLGIIDNVYLMIINDDNTLVEYSKHILNTDSYEEIHTEGSFVKATTSLKYPKGVSTPIGSIFKIIKPNTGTDSDGFDLHMCWSFANKKTYDLRSSFLISITQSALKETFIANDFYDDDEIRKIYKYTSPFEETINEDFQSPVDKTFSFWPNNDDRQLDPEVFADYVMTLRDEFATTKERIINGLCQYYDLHTEDNILVKEMIDDYTQEFENIIQNTECVGNGTDELEIIF